MLYQYLFSWLNKQTCISLWKTCFEVVLGKVCKEKTRLEYFRKSETRAISNHSAELLTGCTDLGN